jgi:hypothetical protein
MIGETKLVDKTFPILMTPTERREYPSAPKAVPLLMLLPHENQALRNHNQSLKRLGERGGLEPSFMLAVLEDRSWWSIALPVALLQLEAHYKGWMKKTLCCSRCGEIVLASYQTGSCCAEDCEPEMMPSHDEARSWVIVHGEVE